MNEENTSLRMRAKELFWKIRDRFPSDKGTRIVFLLVFIVALPLSVYLAQQAIRYFSKAIGEAVTVSVVDTTGNSEITLNSGQSANVKVMLNARTNPIGYSRVVVNFDNSKVNITGNVTTSNQLTMNNADAEQDPNYNPASSLGVCTGSTPCIIKTSVNKANNTGKLVLVLAKDPRVSGSGPTGNFELASFTLQSLSNNASNVSITKSDSQIVNTQEQNLTINTQSLSINGAPPPTEPPPGEQTPYHGTPFSLPATIQAEDYDRGGEGVAYHETTSTNIWGGYRPNEGVDIKSTTDTGGGYIVGDAEPGEWIEYTVDATFGGDYTFKARLAFGYSGDTEGGKFHVEMDGNDITGQITVPHTGSWSTFQTIEELVTITSGQHVMRVFIDSRSPAGRDAADFNWFSLEPQGDPQPTSTPTQPPTGCNTCYNFNGSSDGSVDAQDVLYVATKWRSTTGDPGYDVIYDVYCPNGQPDGEIDIFDIQTVANEWRNSSCTP
jgi:hypothetical protein